MRRTVTIALIGVGLSLSLASEGLASAAAPNVTAPATVTRMEPYETTIVNCKSGTGYTATIVEERTRPDGSKSTTEFSPDANGEDRHTGYLDQLGTYLFIYTCKHTFSGGGTGTWWTETIPIVVEEAPAGPTITPEERKNCKKKKTKKARKRCLKRAGQD